MISCTHLRSGRKATDGELSRIFHNTLESNYVMCLKITQKPFPPLVTFLTAGKFTDAIT